MSAAHEPWIIRYRPLLRPWFGKRFASVTNTKAPRWRPQFWHNPTWTKVRIGSRRRYFQFNSAYMYGRVCRRVAANSRARV